MWRGSAVENSGCSQGSFCFSFLGEEGFCWEFVPWCLQPFGERRAPGLFTSMAPWGSPFFFSLLFWGGDFPRGGSCGFTGFFAVPRNTPGILGREIWRRRLLLVFLQCRGALGDLFRSLDTLGGTLQGVGEKSWSEVRIIWLLSLRLSSLWRKKKGVPWKGSRNSIRQVRSPGGE